MWPLLLALIASVGYGSSDYASGRLARRASSTLIVLATAAAQSLAMVIAAAVTGQSFSAVGFASGAAGGFVGALALIAYYRALALGPAGVVAPIAATSAVLPVVVSAALGAIPGPVSWLGFGAALSGLVILTRSETHDAPERRRFLHALPISLALAASLCFGLAYLFIDFGADQAFAGPLWVLAGVQIGALPTPFLVAGATAAGEPLRLAQLSTLWVPLAGITLLNLIADAALVWAMRDGEVGPVSVLASLAPAVTIGLAHAVSRESLTDAQALGGALTLIGSLLIIGASA